MSKITTANKKAKAEGKLAKKPVEAQPAPKANTCCHCKSYAKLPGTGHYCKLTEAPTPRKSTCENFKHA